MFYRQINARLVEGSEHFVPQRLNYQSIGSSNSREMSLQSFSLGKKDAADTLDIKY